jgi:hypothetical protein
LLWHLFVGVCGCGHCHVAGHQARGPGQGQKILSSRLALAVLDKASWELNDLRLRMQHLEGGDELETHDVLRPEVTSQLLVDQWTAAELPRETWSLVKDVIQLHVVDQMVKSYHLTNEFLIESDVLPDVDLSGRVKRSSAPATSRRPPVAPGTSAEDTTGGAEGGTGASGPGGGYAGSAYGGAGGGGGQGGYGGGGQGGMRQAGGGGPPGYGGGSGGYGNPGGSGGSAGSAGPGGFGGGFSGGGGQAGGPAAGGSDGGGPAGGESAYAASSYARGGSGGSAGEETRMLTGTTPLARARMRATGVLGQLKRMLTDRVAGFDMGHVTRPSPALAAALASPPATQVIEGTIQESVEFADGVGVERVATALRQQTAS